MMLCGIVDHVHDLDDTRAGLSDLLFCLFFRVFF